MDLHGKVALVTGGAHRLGKAIALGLGRAGAHVVVHYHSSAEPAEATVNELRSLGVSATAIPANLAEVAEAEQVVDQAIAYRGQLDILVNSAGIWGRTVLGTVTQERWDELMAINLRAMFFVIQRAVPALRAAGGAVINIADGGVLRPWRNHSAYLISKGGVATLTKALAKDLAPHVRVNAIAPGPVLLPDDWTQEQVDRTAQTVLLKRIGSPDDIADAVVYLAQATYVTGVLLPVDGGQRLS